MDAGEEAVRHDAVTLICSFVNQDQMVVERAKKVMAGAHIMLPPAVPVSLLSSPEKLL